MPLEQLSLREKINKTKTVIWHAGNNRNYLLISDTSERTCKIIPDDTGLDGQLHPPTGAWNQHGRPCGCPAPSCFTSHSPSLPLISTANVNASHISLPGHWRQSNQTLFDFKDAEVSGITYFHSRPKHLHRRVGKRSVPVTWQCWCGGGRAVTLYIYIYIYIFLYFYICEVVILLWLLAPLCSLVFSCRFVLRSAATCYCKNLLFFLFNWTYLALFICLFVYLFLSLWVFWIAKTPTPSLIPHPSSLILSIPISIPN